MTEQKFLNWMIVINIWILSAFFNLLLNQIFISYILTTYILISH
jgi:hypothetical protein